MDPRGDNQRKINEIMIKSGRFHPRSTRDQKKNAYMTGRFEEFSI